MCKLSNLYVVDLGMNLTQSPEGGIAWNVSNSLPQLMNNPCKIVVKQIQTEITDTPSGGTATIDDLLYLRIVHNININSGSNFGGFSTSNVLCFIDTFKVRTIGTTGHVTGSTETECKLFAPNGLPAILTLNRYGATNPVYPLTPVDGKVDNPALSWVVRLEITVNPDQD